MSVDASKEIEETNILEVTKTNLETKAKGKNNNHAAQNEIDSVENVSNKNFHEDGDPIKKNKFDGGIKFYDEDKTLEILKLEDLRGLGKDNDLMMIRANYKKMEIMEFNVFAIISFWKI